MYQNGKLGDKKISHNMELHSGKSKTRMGSCTWSTHPRRHLAEQNLLEHLRVGEEDPRRQKKQNWSKTQKPKTCILFTKTYASPERTFLLIVFSVANFILYVKTCIRLWIMSHHANKFYIHIKSSSVLWPAKRKATFDHDRLIKHCSNHFGKSMRNAKE